MKRKDVLSLIRGYAAEGDERQAVRVYVENAGKVSQTAFWKAYREGVQRKTEANDE